MKIFVALLQLTLAQHLRWFTKCPEPAQMESFDVPAVSFYFFDSIKPKFSMVDLYQGSIFQFTRFCALLERISRLIQLRAVWTQTISFLKSMSERVGSDIVYVT